MSASRVHNPDAGFCLGAQDWSEGRCLNCEARLGTSGPVCEACLRAGLVNRAASEVATLLGPHVQHRERMLARLVEIVGDLWKR